MMITTPSRVMSGVLAAAATHAQVSQAFAQSTEQVAARSKELTRLLVRGGGAGAAAEGSIAAAVFRMSAQHDALVGARTALRDEIQRARPELQHLPQVERDAAAAHLDALTAQIDEPLDTVSTRNTFRSAWKNESTESVRNNTLAAGGLGASMAGLFAGIADGVARYDEVADAVRMAEALQVGFGTAAVGMAGVAGALALVSAHRLRTSLPGETVVRELTTMTQHAASGVAIGSRVDDVSTRRYVGLLRNVARDATQRAEVAQRLGAPHRDVAALRASIEADVTTVHAQADELNHRAQAILDGGGVPVIDVTRAPSLEPVVARS